MTVPDQRTFGAAEAVAAASAAKQCNGGAVAAPPNNDGSATTSPREPSAGVSPRSFAVHRLAGAVAAALHLVSERE